MGYGIPTDTDDGSTLGAFWYDIWRQNHFRADIFTRGTISIGYALILALIAYLRGNWLVGIVAIPVAFLVPIVFGAIVPKEGHIKIFGKVLLLEDIYIYGSLGLAGIAQIVF